MTSVLIVDDSKLARIVVGKAVAALQPEWERIEAASAEDAARLLQQRSVDVAILDYNMPGRNGLELAEDLRGRFPAMPIAVATANLQDEIIGRARAAGASFVAKPITEEGLRGFIAEAEARLQARAA